MHNQFMQAALKQAWSGRGICAPNPSVGAVLVHNNKIISAACHQGAGSPHAEQLLLQKVPADIRAAVLYVTLEPCNHWGRTPPCVKAIIDSGIISSVIYGYSDPNPVVAVNNTPGILRDSGIEVIYHPIPEITAFYQSYDYWIKTRRPWVTAKMAQTFDGRIAGAGGQRVALSNAECKEFTHQQRRHTDIIMTTAQTIITDNPRLTACYNETEHGKPIAILDARLTLSDKYTVFAQAQHCHIYHDAHYQPVNPMANCSYHAVPIKNENLDLHFILAHLGELGFHDVWVEAGGRLFSALHTQQLVQRTYIYLVPRILGEDGVSGYHNVNFFSRPHTVTWQKAADNLIACFEWQEGACLQE